MRNLTPEMAAEYASSNVIPALLAEMQFDSSPLFMWSGIGNLEWLGNTYIGGGNLVGISSIEETQDLQAKGIICSLNGIPSNLIATALIEKSRGRPFRLYAASVATTQFVATEDDDGRVELEDGTGYVLLENQFVDNPYRIFSGLMDVMEFTDDGKTAQIRLSVENSLIIGQRTKVQRYTQEEQRKLYPGDKGLDLINQLQDKEVIW